MAEQFCLRWNNHQSTLVSVFENLLESGTLLDCTISAEGQILRAHKVVLCACSPCFEAMLCVQEDKHPIVFLKDVKFIEAKAMLDYMYKGEVNILQDHLDSFLKVAAELKIKGLTDQGGGGGDTGEPPAKKGPGRKTGVSDVAPESPLVGNAPLREEGSMSPARRRRRPRRPSTDNSADNSCDIPAPVPPAQTPQTQAQDNKTTERLLPIKKQEPMDTPMIQPKTEYVDETNEDIEDLTLDDDEDDYSELSSDMTSKPGTSYGTAQQSSTSQDFSNWQMMENQSGNDEIFMAAQAAINNQSNAQGLCPSCGRRPQTKKKKVCYACQRFLFRTKIAPPHTCRTYPEPAGGYCKACRRERMESAFLNLQETAENSKQKADLMCESVGKLEQIITGHNSISSILQGVEDFKTELNSIRQQDKKYRDDNEKICYLLNNKIAEIKTEFQYFES